MSGTNILAKSSKFIQASRKNQSKKAKITKSSPNGPLGSVLTPLEELGWIFGPASPAAWPTILPPHPDFGAMLGPSWVQVGPKLGHLGGFGVHIGAYVGSSWPILAYLGSIWAYLGPTWALCWPSWPNFLDTWPHLAPTWPHVGLS